MHIEYPKLVFYPKVKDLLPGEEIYSNYTLMPGIVLSIIITFSKFRNYMVIDLSDGNRTIINGGLDECYIFAQKKFEYDIDIILSNCGLKSDE